VPRLPAPGTPASEAIALQVSTGLGNLYYLSGEIDLINGLPGDLLLVCPSVGVALVRLCGNTPPDDVAACDTLVDRGGDYALVRRVPPTFLPLLYGSGLVLPLPAVDGPSPVPGERNRYRRMIRA
jgi:hypothetical protein